MATYNRPALVEEAIRSFQAQAAVDDFELVVADDGSTGPTWKRLRELAATSTCPLRIVRLSTNQGRSGARNAALGAARGDIVAITDDDCVADPRWLAEGLRPFADAAVGVVQGRTRPRPDQVQPLLSHFIHIERFDGTFSTCNVFYRRAALEAVGGFDARMNWWEDLDLGWRVRRAGWQAAFAGDAIVYHQVMPLTLRQWLGWPCHFADMPAKVARYPEYRQYLFLGFWVHWFHALFDLALLALPLGAWVHRGFLALALPYVVAFPFRHGLHGRWPPVKAALHIAWDLVSFGTLVASSLRHRAPVL